MIFDTDRIAGDAAYREDLRHRCITDHFFLAPLLGFHDFTERAHRPVADHYFPKNPNVPISEQDPIHNRMQLDPRFTFKTSFGRVDDVQWILAFPEDITILEETATQPLGSAISLSVSKYFYRPNGRGSTILQRLFPEIVTERKPEATWNTPNRKESGSGDLDHTLDFTSPKSVQSGWHPWVINPDDMVETLNSGIGADEKVRKGVIDTYYTNINTLQPGGYVNLRGTRYHPFDLYGELLSKMDPDLWKVLIRCSITLKNGARLIPGEFPAEEDCILHFPEFVNLTYKSLREKFHQDFESFMCQQQNDPQGGNVPTFDEKMYQASQIAQERIPLLGDTYMCWRLPYSGKPYMAKYAEGAVGRVTQDQKVIILDTWQGTYTPSSLAEKIVRSMKQYEVDGLMIEAMPGTDYMIAHIRNEALRRNVDFRIQWLPFEEDDTVRVAAMKQLEPMMKVGRILFSTAITKAQETRKQFVHFGLVSENGIVDCVRQLADMVPISLMRANMTEEELEMQKRRREDAMLNTFLAQQGMPAVDEQARRIAEAHAAAMENAQNYNFPPLPGGLDG